MSAETSGVATYSGMYGAIDGWWNQIEAYLPLFGPAAWIVVQVTILSILLSWACGLICALAKTSGYKIFQYPAEFYLWFIRGTPLLTQIFLVYFGLPQLGIRLDPFSAGVIALGVNGGAYVAEIIRGGLLSIPKGQRESSVALGMTYWQTMRRIILPQVVRVIIPPMTNDAATTLKNTSLLSTITIMELMLQTQIIVNSTFQPFEFYILVSMIYLAMTTVLMVGMRWAERRHAIAY
ncbi:amino acid ABC transporter permease [Thalassobaculum sp.]|uniref:amino acid ABC transporter permease n=1 Tax=Thalassobaculum sp. TaxID=2022740 RepID=UPI0032EEC8B8